MLYPVELQTQLCKIPSSKFQIPKSITKTLEFEVWDLEFAKRVADGTRTRNSQNHNLELYH